MNTVAPFGSRNLKARIGPDSSGVTDAFAAGLQQEERCRTPVGPAKRGALAVHGITCREVLELLTDYLDGVLAPAVEAAVVTHLEGCEGCRRYLAQFIASIEATAKLREDAVPVEVRETLLAAFRTWPRPDL